MPEPQDYLELLEASVAELQLKTEAHRGGWGLGEFDRWDMDMGQGDLVFSNRDGFTATCPAQVIGSLDGVGGTWMWAWANPSIPSPLKADSLKVKEYGEAHGIDQLTTPDFPADEMDAWRLTALAVKLCESQGAYRGPAGSTAVFMTFSQVMLSSSKPRPRQWWQFWSR